ncbi:MAG: XRE family transcriptional regulator [Anaerolineae bacterium]|nr:XRE family transcriptional regulator [Anaerolineae bacterium]
MFGDWVKEQSKQHGLSQHALSREMDVSQGYISYVINGKKKPSADFCLKLADAFGVSAEYVLRLAGILPKIEEDAITEELIALIRSMSPEVQKEILDYVRFKQRQQK